MSGPGAPPATSDTVHLAEVVSDTTTREWMRAGTLYTATAEQRAVVVEAIEAMHWQRPEEPMAMSPGLLVQEIIAALQLRIVAQVGCSIPYEIRHPEARPGDQRNVTDNAPDALVTAL